MKMSDLMSNIKQMGSRPNGATDKPVIDGEKK